MLSSEVTSIEPTSDSFELFSGVDRSIDPDKGRDLYELVGSV